MNKKKVLLKYTTEEYFGDPQILRRIIYEQEKRIRKLQHGNKRNIRTYS